MRKMSEVSIENANGGAKVKALCWTCYDERESLIWSAMGYGLTQNSAKKNARMKLSDHKDGLIHGHRITYVVY